MDVDESTTSESTPSISPATKSPPESLAASGIVDADTGGEAESKKLPSSKFKGVVPQPNGRWGAQIYEKHQRVWLGTFNEEEVAAGAYDTAAQRFRGGDAVTNFKPLSDEAEIAFLNSHSKPEIVDMLRKHTYKDELDQSRRSYGGNPVAKENHFVAKARQSLFEKSVTPSDVGKLNRLVIPKQHAEKHFPAQNANNCKGVLLNFEDAGGKVWRFRYSYWNSSQSYVLTKGWSRFVKEKGLTAGDVVCFQRSTVDNQLYVDCKTRNNVKPVVRMVRLFGVNIFSDESFVANGSCSGKRMRGMEVLGLECSKKQRVIDVCNILLIN